jgi:hypothetical protein
MYRFFCFLFEILNASFSLSISETGIIEKLWFLSLLIIVFVIYQKKNKTFPFQIIMKSLIFIGFVFVVYIASTAFGAKDDVNFS